MYITEVVRPYANGKASRCVLLRESYRHHGKVKNRTLANLTALPADAIAAIQQVLRRPSQARAADPAPPTDNTEIATTAAPEEAIMQGLSIGAIATVYQAAIQSVIEK